MKNINNEGNTGSPKRPSNRVYPPKKCKNPACGKMFTPTSKRQEYCIPQHRIDYNNDLRAVKDQPYKLHGKKLAHNLAVLKKIHLSLAANNQITFSIQLLQYELYNFGICTGRSINKDTGNEIEWNYNYGIEVKNSNEKTFIIHFRKSID